MQSNCEHAKRRRATRTAALLIAVSALTPPLAAQGTTAPGRTASTPPAPSAEAVARREAQAMLASALTRIAASPNDWRALYDAGRAALVLNDAGSATGFLGRAEQLAPTNGDIKAALGAAMVQMENPRGAIDMFTAARANGAPERMFLADQALAHDLLGEQPAAQRLYERALVAAPSPETERRYALSLGISGQVDRAVAVLSAQLRAQDRAAWRVRSFVLSFNGRHKEANDILYATTPKNVADSISGFLGKMDRLTPAQQAMAAHFGRFPQGTLPPPRVAVAAAPAPAAVTRAPLGETTIERRARLRDERRQGRAAANSRSRPAAVAMATPTPTPAPVRSGTPPSMTPRLAQPSATASSAAPSPVPSSSVAPSSVPSSSVTTPSPGFASSAPAAGSQAVPRVAVTTAPTAPLTMPPATTRPAVPSAVASELAQPAIPAPVATSTPAITTATPGFDSAAVAVASSSTGAEPPSPNAIAATDIPASSAPATPLSAVQGPPSDSAAAPAAVVRAPTAPMPGTTPAVASAGSPSAALPTPMATPAPTLSPATPDVAAPTGFSLADIARSIEIPTEEAARPTGALDAAALEAVRVERLRVAEAAAARREKAAAAAKAKADAEAKVKADAEAKAKAEAKAEADRKKANPARLFVQIAAGANANALAGDYRRIAAKNAAGFKGQTGWTAEWGRTRRLLVGPFKDQKTAQAWLAAHKKAGGDGFPWSSEAGETVTRIGGK